MIGAGVAGVVLLVATGWIWGRPWWQTRALTNALQDIPGVASVKSMPDATFDDHPYAVRFANDVSADDLSRGIESVQRALDRHEIAGDRSGVEMHVGDFLLEPPRERSLSQDVLGAVVALQDVDGLKGIEVDDYEVTMSTADNESLIPVATRALEALASAKIGTGSDAVLRITSRRGNGQLRSTLSGASGQVSLLKGLDRAVTTSGATLRAVRSPTMSVATFARSGRSAECDAELTVGSAGRLRAAAQVVAREAPQCGVTLTVGDGSDTAFELRVQPRDSGIDRALALRKQLERIGATVTQVNSDLGFIGMSVPDAEGLAALRKLTLDPSRWTAPADAVMTVRWGGTNWNALEFKPVTVLQRLGGAMADIRRAGFVASSADRTSLENQLTVTDDAASASDVTTTEGRRAMIDAIKGSDFPGTVRFRISSRAGGTLGFTATAAGKATKVIYPADGPSTSWTRDFIADWNQSAE
jgi:hypothetical protein